MYVIVIPLSIEWSRILKFLWFKNFFFSNQVPWHMLIYSFSKPKRCQQVRKRAKVNVKWSKSRISKRKEKKIVISMKLIYDMNFLCVCACAPVFRNVQPNLDQVDSQRSAILTKSLFQYQQAQMHFNKKEKRAREGVKIVLLCTQNRNGLWSIPCFHAFFSKANWEWRMANGKECLKEFSSKALILKKYIQSHRTAHSHNRTATHIFNIHCMHKIRKQKKKTPKRTLIAIHWKPMVF